MRPVIRLLAYLVVSLEMACFPVFLLAADSSAVLKSTGSVVLNGAGAPATTAIFSGDTVRTANGAVLTISAPGSTVLLPQNSQLTFKGKSINLADGRATVTTTKGMSVTTDHYRIAPDATGAAQYEIDKSGDSLLVRASKGGLTIQSSGKTVTLSQGQVASLNVQQGLLSVQNAGPLGETNSSSPALTSLQDSLSGSDGSTLPICPSASLCKARPSVSGIRPCRCTQF